MSDSPRYHAHVRRVRGLATHSDEPAASYWHGYRLGMVRADRPDQTAAGDDEQAFDRHVAAALAGEQEGDIASFARWCGYHDGMRWEDVTAHRGLLRLAIAVTGGSNRAFAGRLGIDDANVRQMLAGARPVPATRHSELLDVIAGAA